MTPEHEQLYARQPGYVAANLGEELAILDLVNNSYIGFNATAAHVWRLLQEPQTFVGLSQSMVQEFDVDEERCSKELSVLLDGLLKAGLIRIDNG